MRRLKKDDLRSERVLVGPTAADGQRHTGLAMVGLGQVGTSACDADRCAERSITVEEAQLPQLTVVAKPDGSECRLRLT